jgi:hypothetical protein
MMDDDNYYVVPELAGPPAAAPRSMMSAVKRTPAQQWQRRYARPSVLPEDGHYLPHARDGLRGMGWAPGNDTAFQTWRLLRMGVNALSIYAGVQAVRGKKVHDAITFVCLAGAVLDLVDAL